MHGGGHSPAEPFEHFCLMVVSPNSWKDLMDILRQDIDKTRQEEPNCLSFRVGSIVGEPFSITLRTTWTSKASFDAHRSDTSYQTWKTFAADDAHLLHVNEVAISNSLMNL